MVLSYVYVRNDVMIHTHIWSQTRCIHRHTNNTDKSGVRSNPQPAEIATNIKIAYITFTSPLLSYRSISGPSRVPEEVLS